MTTQTNASFPAIAAGQRCAAEQLRQTRDALRRVAAGDEVALVMIEIEQEALAAAERVNGLIAGVFARCTPLIEALTYASEMLSAGVREHTLPALPAPQEEEETPRVATATHFISHSSPEPRTLLERELPGFADDPAEEETRRIQAVLEEVAKMRGEPETVAVAACSPIESSAETARRMLAEDGIDLGAVAERMRARQEQREAAEKEGDPETPRTPWRTEAQSVAAMLGGSQRATLLVEERQAAEEEKEKEEGPLTDEQVVATLDNVLANHSRVEPVVENDDDDTHDQAEQQPAAVEKTAVERMLEVLAGRPNTSNQTLVKKCGGTKDDAREARRLFKESRR